MSDLAPSRSSLASMSLLPMNARDDRQLLEAYACDADEEAFGALVERYAGLVLGVAQRVTGSHQLGEEISQRVFIALARKAKTLRKHSSLAGWLHRAVTLEAAQHFRKEGAHKRKIEAFADQVRIDEQEPAASAWEHLIPFVDDGLNALSSSEREILLLRFYRGIDFNGIGEVIGKSASAAQRQGHRALTKLSAYFERYRVGVSASMLALLFESHLKAAHSRASVGQWANVALAAGEPTLLARVMAMPSMAVVGILAAVAVPLVCLSVQTEANVPESSVTAATVSQYSQPQLVLADAPSPSTLLGKRTALDPVEEVAAAIYEGLKNPDVSPSQGRALRLERLMKGFSAEDWSRFLVKLAAFEDVPEEPFRELLSGVVFQMSSKAPKAAFEFAIANKLSSALEFSFQHWLWADFEGTEAWLKKQRGERSLEEPLEARLSATYAKILSSRDQSEAVKLVRSLEGDDARKALIPLGVELASKSQLSEFYDLVRETIPEAERESFYRDFAKKQVLGPKPPREIVQQFLESVPLSDEERNWVMMAHANQLAYSAGDGYGAEAIDRVISWSSSDRLFGNVHGLMMNMGRIHYDAAEKWIAAQEDVALCDEATAGLAAGLSAFSPEDRWRPLIERIQDADIRKRATDAIAAIALQVEALKAKASAP